MRNQQIDNFIHKVTDIVNQRLLVKLVLGKPGKSGLEANHDAGLRNLIVTLVELKKGLRLQFVYRYQTKDITKNYDVGEGIQVIAAALENDFYNAELFATGEMVQLSTSPNGKVKISVHPVDLPSQPTLLHDRVKERIVATSGNIYLRELGILNSNFEIRREMNDKYLQINKYIELLEPFFADLDLPMQFHVADMGSGKGYLTFALYDYLTKKHAKSPFITGVETRDELVTLSNEIATKAGFENLRFIKGTIREVKLEQIDILIALHACDTATDDAIYRGIVAGASLIVCAPCCHKQVRKEFNVTNVLKNVLKHGILEERQAEIITDGIRSLILESFGYKTRIFEFISTEHTPKNLMIVGRKIKNPAGNRDQYLKRIKEIKDFYGINTHYLEQLTEKLSG
jgi:hypothetical protein